jgi:hypothetical protein
MWLSMPSAAIHRTEQAALNHFQPLMRDDPNTTKEAALPPIGKAAVYTCVDYFWLWLLPWAASECSRAVLAWL